MNPIPSFSRVEITIRGNGDVQRAAEELRKLSGELDAIAGSGHEDEAAAVLAHHKIRAASMKLRGSKE